LNSSSMLITVLTAATISLWQPLMMSADELVFILSQEEVHYVIHAISEKLDNIVCEGGTPFGEDENEEGIVSLSPVNTEEELDMLLAHVLGDDGGGADD
jgi:hypothetical protein